MSLCFSNFTLNRFYSGPWGRGSACIGVRVQMTSTSRRRCRRVLPAAAVPGPEHRDVPSGGAVPSPTPAAAWPGPGPLHARCPPPPCAGPSRCLSCSRTAAGPARLQPRPPPRPGTGGGRREERGAAGPGRPQCLPGRSASPPAVPARSAAGGEGPLPRAGVALLCPSDFLSQLSACSPRHGRGAAGGPSLLPRLPGRLPRRLRLRVQRRPARPPAARVSPAPRYRGPGAALRGGPGAGEPWACRGSPRPRAGSL